MKKVLFSVLLIAMIASMVGAGTWAYFTDYEHSIDNTFTAGSLDLKVDGIDDTLPVYFEEVCLAPCDSGQVEITLMNDGCVPGMLDIMLYNLFDNENEIIEPEAPFDSTPDDGELAENMWMEMWADCTGGTSYDTLIIEGFVADLENDNRYFCDCIADQEVVGLLITWEIDCEVGNEIMTDSIAFDIEFSLEQEPCMYNCWLDVTGFDQPATVIQGSPYNFDVLVHADCDGAEGEASGTVYVEVEDGAGATVWAGSQYVGALPFCTTVPVSFSMPTTGVAVGSYTVVTTDGTAVAEECPFEILEPGALAVTGIQQPPYQMICEDLSVGIDIHNTGGVPTQSMVFTCVVDPLGNPLTAPQFVATGVIDPCQTVKVAVNFGHVDESWHPGGAVVAGFPEDPMDPQEEELYICEMGFLRLPSFEVTGIQQPAGLQPCEDIVIAVDVHNYGDQPGACDVVTMWIEDESGNFIYGPVYGATGFLLPCDTEKVPFASVHADPAWLDTTITVFAQAGGDPVSCPINVLGGPCIEVTGIQQPAEIDVCDELVVAVDVHNAGGKPGECSVEVWVEDELGALIAGPFNADVPMLAPCDTDKIPFTIGHVDESWVPGIVVWAESCCGDPVSCPIVVIPPPTCPVPEPCCWCIYFVQWWAGVDPPVGDPDEESYFALHTDEWFAAGETELVGDFTIIIPDPAWRQVTSFYNPDWSVMVPGPVRFNSILGVVTVLSADFYNSSLTLLNWKTIYVVSTILGVVTVYIWTLDITPVSGNAGWPWAVGNSWDSTVRSTISEPALSTTSVTGTEVISNDLFPGGIECYVVETIDPVTLDVTSIRWFNEAIGCPIREEIAPGALMTGWDYREMVWYCIDPPFTPWQ